MRTPPLIPKGTPNKNRGKRYPPEVLTPAEILRLLEHCKRGPLGRRNRALIVLLWRTGLRISEALALHLKDVDFEQHTVAVLHGKGDRDRVVAVDDGALQVLREWLDVRAREGIDRFSPIFCTLEGANRGGRIWPATVRVILHRLGKRAGIEKRVHAHGFRHACATQMLRDGVPVAAIQVQLGHASIGTTDRYLRRLTGGEVVSAVLARPSWLPCPVVDTGDHMPVDMLARHRFRRLPVYRLVWREDERRAA